VIEPFKTRRRRRQWKIETKDVAACLATTCSPPRRRFVSVKKKKKKKEKVRQRKKKKKKILGGIFGFFLLGGPRPGGASRPCAQVLGSRDLRSRNYGCFQFFEFRPTRSRCRNPSRVFDRPDRGVGIRVAFSTDPMTVSRSVITDFEVRDKTGGRAKLMG